MKDHVPRQLFCFWTGANALSFNRRIALATLRIASGLAVHLITPANLHRWIVEDDPIHPLYGNLSLTHRSDYLRSYFMFHHGGAYSDLKPYTTRFARYCAILEGQPWQFIGSAERDAHGIAIEPQMDYRRYVSNGAFIFKPRSDFAREWRKRVEAVVDENADQLLKTPGTYHPRAIQGGIHDWSGEGDLPDTYPFRWAQLQGEIFHQLQQEAPQSFGSGLRLNRVKWYR